MSCPLISAQRTDFHAPTQKPQSSALSIGSDVTRKIVIAWMVPIYYAWDLCSLAEHPLLKGGQQQKPQVQHNNKADNDSHLPSGFSTQSPATSTVVTSSAREWPGHHLSEWVCWLWIRLPPLLYPFSNGMWAGGFFFNGSTFCLEYDRRTSVSVGEVHSCSVRVNVIRVGIIILILGSLCFSF